MKSKSSSGVAQSNSVLTSTSVVRPNVVEALQVLTWVTVRVAELDIWASLAASPEVEFATALISERLSPKELARTLSRAAEFKLIWTYPMREKSIKSVINRRNTGTKRANSTATAPLSRRKLMKCGDNKVGKEHDELHKVAPQEDLWCNLELVKPDAILVLTDLVNLEVR